MKPPIIKNILIIVPFFSFAQHSKNYLEVMNNLIPTNSSSIETNFGNGKPKYVGTTTYYRYQDKEFSFLTGKYIKYYKNGSRTEGIYDSWGTILENKYFDKNSNLISESETLLLDTTAKDFDEFDSTYKHITIVLKRKQYKYDSRLSKWYIAKEEEHTNGKKSGAWKYYFPNGNLKKQIEK